MNRFVWIFGICLFALVWSPTAGAQAARAVTAAPKPIPCPSGQVLTPQGCLAQNPGTMGEAVNSKGQIVAASMCPKGLVLTSQGCQVYGAVIDPSKSGLVGSGPNPSNWICENGRCCDRTSGACLASAEQASARSGWVCENGRCCDQASGACR